jgi:hypothetical protein
VPTQISDRSVYRIAALISVVPDRRARRNLSPDDLAQVFLDHRPSAGFDEVDLKLPGVDTDHVMALLGQARWRNGPDVSESQYRIGLEDDCVLLVIPLSLFPVVRSLRFRRSEIDSETTGNQESHQRRFCALGN